MSPYYRVNSYTAVDATDNEGDVQYCKQPIRDLEQKHVEFRAATFRWLAKHIYGLSSRDDYQRAYGMLEMRRNVTTTEAKASLLDCVVSC